MFEMTVFDVQHGSAIHLQTPNNRHIAIDLGTGSFSGTTLSPLLHLKYVKDVQALDGLVITHGHRDHLGDVHHVRDLQPPVLVTPRNITDDEIRKGNRVEDESFVSAYLDLRRAYNVSPVAPQFDLTNQLGFGGATIQYFSPSLCPKSNLNNHSIVTVVKYASSTILIPGDNEPASWNELLAQPGFVAAIRDTDILVAPHHGRESAYSGELFKIISPKLTIISDGPLCETSATDRYSRQSSGWTVYDADNFEETRKCLTTRCDGNITVQMYWRQKVAYLNVLTSKPSESTSAMFAKMLLKVHAAK